LKSFDEYTNEPEQLDEVSFLRGASAAVLFQRILSKSKEVQRAKTTNLKLNAIASQNTNLAALVFAMTQFQPDKKGK
tara:strand:+ start:723 stop:953 length:231 start_codon:yes stop_codon:yes gene_type:complete